MIRIEEDWSGFLGAQGSVVIEPGLDASLGAAEAHGGVSAQPPTLWKAWFGWDESKIRRVPAGQTDEKGRTGGQFAPKDGSSSIEAPSVEEGAAGSGASEAAPATQGEAQVALASPGVPDWSAKQSRYILKRVGTISERLATGGLSERDLKSLRKPLMDGGYDVKVLDAAVAGFSNRDTDAIKASLDRIRHMAENYRTFGQQGSPEEREAHAGKSRAAELALKQLKPGEIGAPTNPIEPHDMRTSGMDVIDEAIEHVVSGKELRHKIVRMPSGELGLVYTEIATDSMKRGALQRIMNGLAVMQSPAFPSRERAIAAAKCWMEFKTWYEDSAKWFEAMYGHELLEQVAVFSAITSANKSPETNWDAAVSALHQYIVRGIPVVRLDADGNVVKSDDAQGHSVAVKHPDFEHFGNIAEKLHAYMMNPEDPDSFIDEEGNPKLSQYLTNLLMARSEDEAVREIVGKSSTNDIWVARFMYGRGWFNSDGERIAALLAFRDVARELELTTYQAQAMLWKATQYSWSISEGKSPEKAEESAERYDDKIRAEAGRQLAIANQIRAARGLPQRSVEDVAGVLGWSVEDTRALLESTGRSQKKAPEQKRDASGKGLSHSEGDVFIPKTVSVAADIHEPNINVTDSRNIENRKKAFREFMGSDWDSFEMDVMKSGKRGEAKLVVERDGDKVRVTTVPIEGVQEDFPEDKSYDSREAAHDAIVEMLGTAGVKGDGMDGWRVNKVKGLQKAFREEDHPRVPKGSKHGGEFTTSTPGFKKWFEGSKVVDESGAPLVVYHGTQADFDVFDQDHARSVSSDDQGYFFTSNPEEASNHATHDWWREEPQPNVMPVYLSIKNPMMVDGVEEPARWYDSNGKAAVDRAMRSGHDGLIVGGSLYIAFRSDQIKSAIGNSGFFDQDNSDITKAFVEADHPRAPEGSTDPKYKGGRFIPKMELIAADRVHQSAMDDVGRIRDRRKRIAARRHEEKRYQDTLGELGSNFAKWFRDSKVVDEFGAPLVVYHGTLSDFSKFESSSGNTEGHFGAGIYFTNNPVDASKNYADTEGADWQNKLDDLANEIQGVDQISFDEAEREAKKILFGKARPNVMPVYLSIQNPLFIGGEQPTRWGFGVDVDDDGNEVIPDEPSIFQFCESVRLVIEDGSFSDADSSGLFEYLEEMDGDTASQIISKAKDFEGICFASDDNGRVAVTEIIRQALERMGYDGIVDREVSRKFSGMGLSEGDTHYVVFSPNQVKSATGNKGTFSPKKDSIIEQGDAEQLAFEDIADLESSDAPSESPGADPLARLLRGVENEIRSFEHEVGVIYDIDSGSRVVRTAGDHNRVEFSREDMAAVHNKVKGGHKLVLTHNHPGEECGLSPQDLYFMMISGLHSIRAVTHNYTYAFTSKKLGVNMPGDMGKEVLLKYLEDIWSSGIKHAREAVLDGKISRSEFLDTLSMYLCRRVSMSFPSNFEFSRYDRNGASSKGVSEVERSHFSAEWTHMVTLYDEAERSHGKAEIPQEKVDDSMTVHTIRDNSGTDSMTYRMGGVVVGEMVVKGEELLRIRAFVEEGIKRVTGGAVTEAGAWRKMIKHVRSKGVWIYHVGGGFMDSHHESMLRRNRWTPNLAGSAYYAKKPMKKGFDESAHPRAPEGSDDPKYSGGRFIPKQTAVHYSRKDQGDQFTLDPSHYGEGKAGMERERVEFEGAPDRSYVYLEGARHEPAVRTQHKYHVRIPELEKIQIDPGESVTDAEKRMKDAGAPGYEAPDDSVMPRTAALFEPFEARRASDVDVGITAYGGERTPDMLAALKAGGPGAFFDAAEPILRSTVSGAPGVVIEGLERGEGVYQGEGEPTHVFRCSTSEPEVLMGRLARYAKQFNQFSVLYSRPVAETVEGATISSVLTASGGITHEMADMAKRMTEELGKGCTISSKGIVFHYVTKWEGDSPEEHVSKVLKIVEALKGLGAKVRVGTAAYLHTTIEADQYDEFIEQGERREQEIAERDHAGGLYKGLRGRVAIVFSSGGPASRHDAEDVRAAG